MISILKLISFTVMMDDIGNTIKAPFEKSVIGVEMAVYNNTYYQAAQAGLKPSKMFEVYTTEYSGETMLECDDVIYRIIKSHPAKIPARTVLTCERAEGDN